MSELGMRKVQHDFSRTWSSEDQYKENNSASIADRNFGIYFIVEVKSAPVIYTLYNI